MAAHFYVSVEEVQDQYDVAQNDGGPTVFHPPMGCSQECGNVEIFNASWTLVDRPNPRNCFVASEIKYNRSSGPREPSQNGSRDISGPGGD